MRYHVLVLGLLPAAIPAAAQDPRAAAASDSAAVYELAQVETMPQPVNVAELRAALEAGYPAARRQTGAEATVNLSMIVGADGVVRQPQVLSSTDSAFAEPSLAAIAVLRFTPGTVGGVPVATRVEIPVRWQVAAAAAPERGIIRRVARPAVDSVRAAADTVTAYELAQVEEQPRPTNVNALRRELERRYPPELRDQGARATVQVRFRVTPQGTTDAFSISSTTDRRFNQATIDAVRLLRFTPARVNGRAVYVWVELPIQWEVGPAQGRDRQGVDTRLWDPGTPSEPAPCRVARC